MILQCCANFCILADEFSYTYVAVQLPICARLFATPWTAACQASLSFTISQICPSSCSLRQWCHPAMSSSDPLFFCPQSFPASGSFPVCWLFTSDDQNAGASVSASVFPRSIQGWYPLRLTGLILLSKGLSGVFSSTTVRRHQFFGSLPSLPSTSHNHRDHWGDRSLDHPDLFWQSNVSALQHTV